MRHELETIADFLMKDLEGEIPATMAVFGAVPESGLGYTPHEKSKTALGLVRHMTLEDEWILNSIADGQFTPPPDDSDQCGMMTPADAIARYKERIPAAIAKVRAMSGEKLGQELNFMDMFKMPAINFISMMVRHTVHHRGQLSTYLRPMGSKIPPIYGPTADTQ